MTSELDIKTERIRLMLEREKLDGVLMNTQHNFSWLSGGRSNGIDMTRENGAGFLLVTRDGGRHVVANNIEIERLLSEELPENFHPIEITWQAEKDPETVLNAARSVLDGGNIGCDIGFPETRWVEPAIAECRFELTLDEIARYKELGRDCARAIDNAVPQLAPGQTETEIARIARNELASFDIYPVVTLVAADARIARFRHPVPTGNVWRDVLMIVICARRHGLIASLTRMICAGKVSADLQNLTESCAAVNAALYDATKVGMTGSKLYGVAADAYAGTGFGEEIDKHHQGGACGYRTRDWVAHPSSQDIVRPNQAFAWNPSITGTKTEETGILTDDGLEIITASDAFPKIPVIIDGREYFSPGILSLSKGVSA